MNEELPDTTTLTKVAPPSRPVPDRFKVPRKTLLIDRAMNQIIRVGGLGITLAVFAIFFFIFIEVLPLFHGAEVEQHDKRAIAAKNVKVMGVDEWAEVPFIYDGGNSLRFFALNGDRGEFEMPLEMPENFTVSAVRYRSLQGHLILGSTDGRVAVFELNYGVDFSSGERQVIPSIGKPKILNYEGEGNGGEITDMDFAFGANFGILATIQKENGEPKLHVVTYTKRKGLSLGGAAGSELDKLIPADNFNLTEKFDGIPARLIASSVGDNFLVANETGTIHYFSLENEVLDLRQTIRPFDGAEDPTIGSMEYILGDHSIITTGMDGSVYGYSLYRAEDSPRRLYGKTKEFQPLKGGPATFFLASGRNKSFFYGRESNARLANLTAESERWRSELPFTVAAATLDGKGEHAFLIDTEGALFVYAIEDPHPEASVRAFFGEVWYEGRNKPEKIWQSTGGTDDFESKLSMMPLIFGSLKGTFYAMLFAVPIALLAAVYCAAFVRPEAKRIIKPVMEIMASLPSVVLGFLAGLVLAPMIETKVPSVLMTIIMLPVFAILFGWLWSKLPVHRRAWLRPGTEWLMLIPVSIAAILIGWSLGPVVENLFFYVHDANGTKIADFRLWWPEFTDSPYSQRNSLVLGFMMGFAVIPIIFTISEDALSNVPPSLLAASSALGASRWQTARSILIPVAAAGIFSALMIGFGRAVGETMIVVMASGNTPITEWNIFSGMRTLSANIAVELPEAPVSGTHYRALFLGAMILFLMTFAINTLAEVLRQRLREKFKIV